VAVVVALEGLNAEGKRSVFYLAPALAYAIWIRKYWLFVFAASFIVHAIMTRFGSRGRGWRRLATLLICSFVLIVLLALLFQFSRGESLDALRLVANQDRLATPDAQTIISPVFSGSSFWSGVLNTFVTQFRLALPLPLAKYGPLYAIAAVTIASLWTGALVPFVRRPFQEHSRGAQRAFAISIAFLIAQAAFEPDYGSYVRHLAAMLPITLLAMTRNRAYSDSRAASSPASTVASLLTPEVPRCARSLAKSP